MWFIFALLSAVFAALTSILAKVGINGVNSNLATAIRTVVVVIMAPMLKSYLHRMPTEPGKSPHLQELACTRTSFSRYLQSDAIFLSLSSE